MFQRFENELENLLKSIKETLVTNSKSVRKLKVPTKVPLKSRPAHTIHTAMPARSSGAQPPRDASSVSLRVKGKTELTLEIVNGDITEETTDAIVSPTDEKLNFAGNSRQFVSRQPISKVIDLNLSWKLIVVVYIGTIGVERHLRIGQLNDCD